MNQFKYWDKVAEDKDFPTHFAIKNFEKYVSKGMKILDLGCGYGRTLNELYINGFSNLTGVDYSVRMIRRGLKKYPYLNLIVNDGDTIPFPDKEFKAVILIGVLTSNIKDLEQEKLLKELSRILSDQGILYIADFLINYDARNIERYNKYKDKYETYGVFELPEGVILRHHTEDYIKNLLRGFKELCFKKTVYKTMNNHKSNGFYFIGKKD